VSRTVESSLLALLLASCGAPAPKGGEVFDPRPNGAERADASARPSNVPSPVTETEPQAVPPAETREKRATPPPGATTVVDLSRERALVEEAESALKSSDYARARAKASSAIDGLLARAEGERGAPWLGLLDTAGHAAWSAQSARDANLAWSAVLEVRSRTLSDDHPDLQPARGNLAVTIKALGDIQGARLLEEQVLEVLSRTLPDEHGNLQAARLNLASTLKELGDLQGARALLETVVEVFSRTLPDEHPDLQVARGSLAVTIGELGDLQGARALLERVVEVFSRTLPDEHPNLQNARQNLAVTIQALGDLQDARTLFEKVFEVRSRTLPDEHPKLQDARQNLAATIQALGDLQGARALEEKVLEVRSRTLPDEHPDLQAARLNLAITIGALGDLQGARALKERVLEVLVRTLPEEHPDLQSARLSLAATLRSLGDLQGSRVLAEEAVEVLARTLPDEHPSLQAARLVLAVTLRSLGDLHGARALYEKVFELRSRMLPDEHPDLQAARQNLASTLVAEYSRGSAGAGDGEGERERGEGRERCVELLAARFAAQRRVAQRLLLEATPREAEARCSTLAQGLGFALSLAGGMGGFTASRELELPCFTLSETTRGAALGSASVMRTAAGAPEYGHLRNELASSSRRLAELAAQGTTSEEFRATREQREALERELVALGKKLGGARLAAVEFDAGALAATLGEREAIVTYRRYSRYRVAVPDSKEGDPSAAPVETGTWDLCAFVLRRGESEPGQGPSSAGVEPGLTLVELGPIAPIEAAVIRWRESLGTASGRGLAVAPRSTGSELGARGNEVRELVFDPLRAALGDAERVILVLDDVLHLVPFDVLPAEEGERELLGDRLRIETRATAMELMASVPRLEGGGELLAIGGVAFDERAPSAEVAGILRGGNFGGFAPLPATEVEVEALAASYAAQGNSSSASVLRGGEATREQLLELAPRARWLHVATHGWIASESIRSWADPEPIDKQSGLGLRLSGEETVKGMSPMLLCGLALAGANLSEDASGRAPGLITAQEIAALDLTQCELAVLSACDTNVGVRERRAGQGVASLQMALQMAGARSVVTSLWKVPDEATKELMLDFYRRIWVEKQPKAQALWEAKETMRDAKDARGEPKYTTRDWGAWVLTGSPD